MIHSTAGLFYGPAASDDEQNDKYLSNRKIRQLVLQRNGLIRNLLRQHLPITAVISNINHYEHPDRQLEQNELWPGESADYVYRVGCYSVRISDRIYCGSSTALDSFVKGAPYNKPAELKRGELFAHYKPVKQGEIEAFKAFMMIPTTAPLDLLPRYIWGNEVSAAFLGDTDAPEYQFVHMCRKIGFLLSLYPLAEQILFIGTVKKDKQSADRSAHLMIAFECDTYTHTDYLCCLFSPNGVVQVFDMMSHKKWKIDWSPST